MLVSRQKSGPFDPCDPRAGVFSIIHNWSLSLLCLLLSLRVEGSHVFPVKRKLFVAEVCFAMPVQQSGIMAQTGLLAVTHKEDVGGLRAQGSIPGTTQNSEEMSCESPPCLQTFRSCRKVLGLFPN